MLLGQRVGIAVAGDSIQSTLRYPPANYRWGDGPAGTSVVGNTAVGGGTMHALRLDWTPIQTAMQPIIANGWPRAEIWIGAGYNDLKLFNNAAVLLDDAETLYTAVHNRLVNDWGVVGYVIMFTIPESAEITAAGANAARLTYNAALRAFAAGHSDFLIVDLAADAQLGSSIGNPLYADDAHPTEDGCIRIGRLAANALALKGWSTTAP